MNVPTFGKGKDVIFMHGWGGDASAFLFCAKRLESEYRCHLAEFAGFGESAPPARPYTVRDYAREIVEYMNSTGIEKAVLVGHSFGGRVAMEIAAAYPERVKSVVLVDSAGIKPKRKFSYYVKVALHKTLKKLGFAGLKGSSDYQGLSDVMKQTFVKVVNYDQTPILRHISCPTAIFWGKDDKDTPPYMAEIIHNGIKDSHVFMLDGGHFAYLEEPEKFFAVLRAFLKETA